MCTHLRHIALVVLTWSLLAMPSLSALAQDLIKKDQPVVTLNAEQRGEVLEGALKHLNDHYIFPDKAREMDKAVRARQDKKEYDGITSPRALAETLTKHFQEISHDKHLRVMYSPEPLPKQRESRPTPEERHRMRERMSKNNFGFEKVERLEGNVGYLDLRGFMEAEAAGETAAAAMSFLANTDALIIDLRKNGGGSPGMVALLCSYLFDGPPRHLNSLHWRRPEGEEVQQWWTLAYVPGKRYVGKDAYVLTSKRTFSAAEEFTYNLQTQKRATIVGETTGGGAHPGGTHPITDHFLIWVPSGRAVNPITKTNWEGSGVKPDIDVPADQALKTAHLAALKKSLAEKKTDEVLKDQLKKLVDKLQKELDALKKPAQTEN
jgi:C-terminal processing protease CtpA/Prc